MGPSISRLSQRLSRYQKAHKKAAKKEKGASPQAMADKPVQILCFGDSLTSGYHDFGINSHPYAIAFAAMLRAALPHMAFDVHHNGKPGDVGAWPAFNERLKQECAKRHYDWVIILAGTNDLAYRVPPQDMYKAFQSNWNVPLSQGSKVLALTVPESRAKPSWVIEARDELNALIRNHKEPNLKSAADFPQNPAATSYTFDLHAKLPYHSLSEQDREKYWDDGLHLTAQGYDWMGGHVAEGFLAASGLAKQQDQQQPSGPAPASTTGGEDAPL
ncbi:hypothetical protein E4U41_003757 [Claviceps citrina]|nr:hypothetical protein E4U41_003757 [Claviceps citrina]